MTEHRSKRLVNAILADTWMMEPGKLEDIAEFLEMRANGIVLTAEQIRESMAQQQASSFAALSQEQAEEDKPIVRDGVQVMQLFGSLAPRMNLVMSFSGGTSTQQFSTDITRAAANPDVKTALIEVDSPGGAVAGTEEGRMAVKAAVAKGLRVVMVARNLMASAAYYIGAAGSEVIATPSTEVGSIGVFAIIKNIAKASEAAGVTFHVIRSVDLKAAGNPYEELTAERRASLQRRVDEPYKMFLAAVAEDRNTTTADVEENFGRGAVMLAERAKAVGMIDRVALIEDVFAEERDRNKSRATVFQVAAPDAADRKADGMNAKLKAALFSHGLIDDMEASEDVCKAALNAWVIGQGIDVPTDDTAALSALNAAPAANIKKAHDNEFGEAEERQRVEDIYATADAFGASDEDTRRAVTLGTTHEEFVKIVREKKAASEKAVAKVVQTGSGEDRWAEDAVDAMAYRVMRSNNRQDENASDDVKRLAHAPLLQFAAQSLEYAGETVGRFDDTADIAERAMSAQGAERHAKFFSPHDMGPISAADAAYNRPGSFPNLLSNLANKILDDAIDLAAKPYDQWTATYSGGLKDFKPAPIVNKGQADELAEVMDAEAFREVTLSEEVLSYLFLRRYGNKVGFTPVMIANDDMNALTEDAYALGEAWETTVNRLCVGILTSNAALLDTYSLFDDTNHGNHVDSGAILSDAQIAAHEVKFAAQTGIGTTQTIDARADTVLVPTGLVHQAARRTLLTYEELRETKEAATTANVGLYRGQMNVVVDPLLNGTSATAWYSLCQPTQFRRATVIRAYFRGYGTRGRRERWYDPNTKTTWVSLEGRIGAAAKSYRYAIKDDGA